MIVGSFFCMAQAIGGLFTIIYIMSSTDFGADKLIGDSLSASLLATHVPAATSGITSFLILFLGGRWILRGPRLIERWIAEGRIHKEAPQLPEPN